MFLWKYVVSYSLEQRQMTGCEKNEKMYKIKVLKIHSLYVYKRIAHSPVTKSTL